jgi:hypothetical protein
METEKELNSQIMLLTLKIHEKHPELAKYLNEMPVTIPHEASPEITIKALKDYCNSLEKLLNEYGVDHSTPVPDLQAGFDTTVE